MVNERGHKNRQAGLPGQEGSQTEKLEDQVVHLKAKSNRILRRSNGSSMKSHSRPTGACGVLASTNTLEQDSRPKGVIPISSTVTVDLAVGQTKPNAFQIQTKARTFFISAGNSTLRDQWITSIKQIATNLRESESSDTANQ